MISKITTADLFVIIGGITLIIFIIWFFFGTKGGPKGEHDH